MIKKNGRNLQITSVREGLSILKSTTEIQNSLDAFENYFGNNRDKQGIGIVANAKLQTCVVIHN